MWIMTPGGFVSIVNKEGGLQVRARDRQSLEWFGKQAGIPKRRIVTDWEEKYRDYPYRMKDVPTAKVKRFLAAEVDGITYSNFKNEAKRVRGAVYANALSRVWTNMLALTPPGVDRAMRAADRKRIKDHWWTRTVDSREADASLDGKWSESWWLEHYGKGAKDRDQMDADSDFSDLEDDDDLVSFIDKKIGDMTEDEWRAFQENLASGI